MTKRRISKDKYDELLRELGVIHKIGKYGSLLKDGDGNFDVLACISSETIALEYILGDMDIPDYHMEYLKESLKQRKKIHKTLLNGKFRPHEDEMELLEDYKRALGMYLGHDTGWNKENSLLSFTNTEPLTSTYIESPERIQEYNNKMQQLEALGIGCCDFGESDYYDDGFRIDEEKERKFIEAEDTAIKCIFNNKEIPDDVHRYLLDTLDIRKKWSDHNIHMCKDMSQEELKESLQELKEALDTAKEVH